jgi:hypothetical protein
VDFIMANQVTADDAKKIMNDVLVSKSINDGVDGLIKKINSFPSFALSDDKKKIAIDGINSVQQEIANTINANVGKTPEQIAMALQANTNITNPLSELNKNYKALGFNSVIDIAADVKKSSSFNSLASSLSQDKSNEKPTEKTQTTTPPTVTPTGTNSSATNTVSNTPTSPPPTTTPTTPTLTPEEIAAAEKKKKEQESANQQANAQPKNPLLEFLKNIPVLGPILVAMLGGGDSQNQSPANPPVANNPTTPTTNSNDVALNTPTQAPTPTQNPPITPVTPLNTPPNLQAKQPTIGRAG